MRLMCFLVIANGNLNYHGPPESLKIINSTIVELTFNEVSEINNTFYGSVTLNFQYDLKEQPPDYIYLQASKEYLNIHKVTCNGIVLSENEYNFEKNSDTLKVLWTNQTAEIFYLKIEYEGIISSFDNFGVYKKIFVENDNTNIILATNLASTYSGRVIPNFEPLDQKIGYEFHITVPEGLNVIFNTPLQSYDHDKSKK